MGDEKLWQAIEAMPKKRIVAFLRSAMRKAGVQVPISRGTKDVLEEAMFAEIRDPWLRR